MAKTFICNADYPVVQTKAGKVRGYFYDGNFIFKGVKYATAKRFQMPEDVEPWEGIKDATSYGFVCPLMGKETPNGEVMVPHRYWPQDEDCLNLNVWTTSLDNTAKKPVMVWFHGGGFSAGSSIEQVSYDGANMSKLGDVVVVTVNHRLNILGYLDLSPFGEKYWNSGNSGSADLVASLKWVHENIENFGGDPQNVTIFGQSGGGAKVVTLLQMPAADEYFQKGIVMSGVTNSAHSTPKDGGTKIVTAMLEYLGLTTDEVEKLETLPYTTLVEAYKAVSGPLRAAGCYVGQRPMMNDYFLGEPQFEGFTERAKKTPLMVGSVICEMGFRPLGCNKYELSDEEMRNMLLERYGEEYTDRLIDAFAKAYPDKKAIDLINYDIHVFRPASKELIYKKAEYTEAPTYSYMFAFEFPYENGKPSWHCSDIPFFFHNVDLVPVANVPGVSDKMEEQIFQAVMNFAHTGNPNHAELPYWPASTPDDEATMVFDRTCEVRHNYDNELIDLLLEATAKSTYVEKGPNNVQH